MAEYKSSPYNKPKKKTSPKDEKTRVFNGELKPLMSESEKAEAQMPAATRSGRGWRGCFEGRYDL